MPKVKRNKLYLDKLGKVSKNPPPRTYVLIYTEIDDEVKPVKKSKTNRMTLEKLAKIVDAGFKQDRMTIAKLAEEMRAGFNRIDNRLDYIVKANNLKDLPNNK